MKTCTKCWWRTRCTRRSSLRRYCPYTGSNSPKPPPIVGIALAMLLGTLMWAVLIYALPLVILAAKGF